MPQLPSSTLHTHDDWRRLRRGVAVSLPPSIGIWAAVILAITRL
jgi:hypothetical protein